MRSGSKKPGILYSYHGRGEELDTHDAVPLQFYHLRLGLIGLVLGIVLLALTGMANGPALPLTEDLSFATEALARNPLPAVPRSTSNGHETSVSVTSIITESSTVFSSIVYRDYSMQSLTTFMPVVYHNQKYLLAPLCRYGIAAWGEQLKWLPTWRAGWTLDFSAHEPPFNISAEFVQVIRVRQLKDGCSYLDDYRTIPALTDAGLGALISKVPGAIWIVGNEPDRGPNPEDCLGPGQDDTYPEMYARAYHDVYHFIKQRDPTARIAIAGLVQVTPGRLQYLDKVWQEYRRRYGTDMPVDVWNMHLYILPEVLSDGRPNGIANVALGTDPALGMRESGGDPNRCSDPQVYCYAEHDDMTLFAEQVVAMRAWMKEHGQQNKPLILSEYSLLYPHELDAGGCFLRDEFGQCFTPERVSTFMTRTFEYLETAADPALGYPLDGNRLVQRWMWFSAYYPGAGSASNLLNTSVGPLSLVGEQFKVAVEAKRATVNLTPGAVGSYSAPVGPVGETTTATLWVHLLNNGNTDSTFPFRVTFYADTQLSRPIGSITVGAPLGGCSVMQRRASITWDSVTVGSHQFWVKLDSDDLITEEDETDNVISGMVTVYRYGTFLPLTLR